MCLKYQLHTKEARSKYSSKTVLKNELPLIRPHRQSILHSFCRMDKLFICIISASWTFFVSTSLHRLLLFQIRFVRWDHLLIVHLKTLCYDLCWVSSLWEEWLLPFHIYLCILSPNKLRTWRSLRTISHLVVKQDTLGSFSKLLAINEQTNSSPPKR